MEDNPIKEIIGTFGRVPTQAELNAQFLLRFRTLTIFVVATSIGLYALAVNQRNDSSDWLTSRSIQEGRVEVVCQSSEEDLCGWTAPACPEPAPEEPLETKISWDLQPTPTQKEEFQTACSPTDTYVWIDHDPRARTFRTLSKPLFFPPEIDTCSTLFDYNYFTLLKQNHEFFKFPCPIRYPRLENLREDPIPLAH